MFARLLFGQRLCIFSSHHGVELITKMAQSMTSFMAGLTLATPTSPSSKQPTSSQYPPTNGNRLPPVLKKYMNPGLIRPPNTGLANHNQSAYNESQRGPLLKLAGIYVPLSSPGRKSSSKPGHTTSPPGKSHHKPSLSQHTAHGLHGPAHSTASRAMSSSINPAHTTHPTATGIRKVEIGKYDGGLEADDAGRDVVTGDAAKILEMDSTAAG